MKVPHNIVGKNKIRDYSICLDYCGDLSVEEIAAKHKLTFQRIYKILHNNTQFVNENIGWGKSKRLKMLQMVAAKAGLKLSQGKDITNVIEQMRKEIEGDKPLIDNSTHVTNIIDNTKKKEILDRVRNSERELFSTN